MDMEAIKENSHSYHNIVYMEWWKQSVLKVVILILR